MEQLPCNPPPAVVAEAEAAEYADLLPAELREASLAESEATPCSPAELEGAAASAALTLPEVTGARAIATDDGVLVAVLTGPIYLSSRRAELKSRLESDIEKATGIFAIVTFDLGVYRKIKPSMTQAEKDALYADSFA